MKRKELETLIESIVKKQLNELDPMTYGNAGGKLMINNKKPEIAAQMIKKAAQDAKGILINPLSLFDAGLVSDPSEFPVTGKFVGVVPQYQGSERAGILSFGIIFLDEDNNKEYVWYQIKSHGEGLPQFYYSRIGNASRAKNKSPHPFFYDRKSALKFLKYLGDNKEKLIKSIEILKKNPSFKSIISKLYDYTLKTPSSLYYTTSIPSDVDAWLTKVFNYDK